MLVAKAVHKRKGEWDWDRRVGVRVRGRRGKRRNKESIKQRSVDVKKDGKKKTAAAGPSVTGSKARKKKRFQRNGASYRKRQASG